MERLFLFLFHYRAFFTFLILQLACIWIIVSSNHYQRALFFNSSGSFIASLNSFSFNIGEYFNLREINKNLAKENTQLRNQLEKKIPLVVQKDTSQLDTGVHVDTLRRYHYISAKVVNNSIDRFTNFITIDKGAKDGIEKDMAIISHQGAIGKVKSTSPNFSVITSLLNIDVMVSSLLKRTGHLGTVQWNGRDPQYVNLNYIPRHVAPHPGDSVVTSGYNAIFPKGILIGVIEEVPTLGEADQFHYLKVKLAQDFQQLNYVVAVQNILKTERDSLEQEIKPMSYE